GGGLGGGSSDAATTLIALNHLWGLHLPRERLQEIGLALGADVPVFVYGRNCFAEGVGERFTDVAVPEAWYLLSFPKVQVPTADIFRSPSLKRDTPAIPPSAWTPGFGHNDLEPVACALFPEVARHLAVLHQFGDARMTGSGACCFVSFATRVEAERARLALPADFRGEIIRGLSLHPLAKLE
ncbi:MAG: 4-(cytidine 5'-diphospho)-2-C-methyl-D-erythritol kinase, partial [Rhodocyclaceae bacterium]